MLFRIIICFWLGTKRDNFIIDLQWYQHLGWIKKNYRIFIFMENVWKSHTNGVTIIKYINLS